jgi:hypothetical protein
MKKTILALLVTGLIGAQAYAFTGSIEFTGAMSGHTKKGTTTITFTNPWSVVAGIVDYGGVPAGTPATFNAFSYTGTGLTAVLTAPVIPQWTFTFSGVTYSFDLTNLTSATLAGGAFVASGTGTAHIGAQSQSAIWSLQGNANGKFTLSSSTTTSLPDGGSAVALLGIALAGIEGARRLIRSRKP